MFNVPTNRPRHIKDVDLHDKNTDLHLMSAFVYMSSSSLLNAVQLSLCICITISLQSFHEIDKYIPFFQNVHGNLLMHN